MLQRNNPLFLVILVCLLAFGMVLNAQNAPSPQTQSQQQQPSQPELIPPLPDEQQPPVQQPPAQQTRPGEVMAPLPQRQQPPNAGQGPTPVTPNPPNQPGDTVQVQQSPVAPTREQNGTFVFQKNVQEVVLHATVVDEHQRLVNNLDRTAFTVYEDGRPQQITSFRHEDIPVALGIVIDDSGSMRLKRPAVEQAAINLVQASNPHDEVFVVNFNDEYWLDQDFTGNVQLLKTALEHIEARGGTALYDAIVASADHLKKNARLEKKVIMVVTDGEDNASRESLEQAIRKLQAENGPTVYTVGLLWDDSHKRRAQRALQEIAEQTGGVAFFPKDLAEVDAVTRAVAHDIRNQYTIGYKPERPQVAGGYRTVKVEAHARGYSKLQVRTRSGYYAGQERASR